VDTQCEAGGEEKKLDMAEQKMVEEAEKKTPKAKANNHGLEDEAVENGHIQRLPDMTGKIITVSAEETLKLTKDKEHKKGKGKRRGDKKDIRPVQEWVPSKSEEELMADVEREFQEFIANLSSTKIEPHENTGDEGVHEPPSEEGSSMPLHQIKLPVKPSDDSETKGACMSEHTLDAMLDNIDDEAKRKSEYTVDYTIDTWSTRQQTETTLVDPDTSIHDSSDFDSTAIYAKNSDTNDTIAGVGSRISSSRRSHQPFHRSSLRQSSNWDNEKPASDRPGGISWASLINMDSERKKKSPSSVRRTAREKSQLSSSILSGATPDSKVSSWSKNTKSSWQSKNSYGSKKSDCSKRSNGSGNTVSWKDESNISMASCKDPVYIRKQAKERFERGLHYAKRGKFAVARERFLVALRYRVRHRGPTHPDVAAVHEMLGHTNYFLSEEVSLLRLDGGEAGWDVTILENDKSKRRDLEKAAMHYQTVLDILGSNQLLDESKRSAVNSVPENDTFKWSDIAESYNGLEGHSDDEDTSQLATENVIEIVARVQEKLASLQVAVTDGKSKSYATTFLDS